MSLTFAEKVKSIGSLPYEKYSSVSSREKLVVYAMSYLEEIGIPLNFNNICVATFRLFPEKFYFSEDFKEYPHIEMLNRTILHLRPVERNYATGSVKTDYALTTIGREIAKQVKTDIEVGVHNVAPKQVMDSHKKTSGNDLRNLRSSLLFGKWVEGTSLDDMEIWDFFGVTPFTQVDKVKKYISEVSVYAKSVSDDEAVKFLSNLKSKIE